LPGTIQEKVACTLFALCLVNIQIHLFDPALYRHRQGIQGVFMRQGTPVLCQAGHLVEIPTLGLT
jgi:hypothetical protein